MIINTLCLLISKPKFYLYAYAESSYIHLIAKVLQLW